MTQPLKELIAEVKACVDLVTLVGKYVELCESGSYHVGRSLKNRDTNPSLKVKRDGRWRDYSAGVGGDCINFLQYATGCSFMEALRELGREVGISMPGVSSEAKELKEAEERRRIEELLTEATRFYFDGLPGSMRHEYWQRGFTEETIDHFQLGFGRPGLWTHFDKLGVPENERLSTGLFVRLKTGEIADFFANRLVFPYWHGGHVVYLIGRRSPLSSDEPWDLAKYRKLLTQSDKHPYISEHVRNDYFFVSNHGRPGGVVLICEGIADAIAAWQAGYDCISPVTTTFRRQDQQKLVHDTARAKRLVIINDSEENGAGDKGAIETAKVLHAARRDVRLATIPRPADVMKVDVNDVVKDQGPDALKAIVEAAKSLPEFLLDRIPSGLPTREIITALKPIVGIMQHTKPLERAELKKTIAERFNLGRRDVNQQFKVLEREVRDGQRRVVAETKPEGDKPTLLVNGRQRSDLIDETSGMLTATNIARIGEAKGVVPDDLPLLFVRGGRVVGLLREKQEDKAPKLSDLDATEMYGLLVRFADWLRMTDYEQGPISMPTTPPPDLPKDLLAFPPRALSPLDSVVSTPVFGRSGSFLSTPGYHASESLWLHLDPTLGELHVPESPTAADLASARALLIEHLLVDFPFVDPGDRTHMIAALLLPFARRLISGCTPLHVIEAPTVGSGKGLLVNILGILATGMSCNGCTLPGEEEEVRRKLTAELAMGRPILLLDNLPEKRTTDSATLASVLTSETWTDRVLGETRMLTLPNRAMWVCSANNPTFSLELARRSVRIRIDPKLDMPWRRGGFRHDPILEWVSEKRPTLVGACLTLVQAWIAAGQPRGKQRLGSFESWAATMGGILEVASIDGFLANSTAFYAEADEEGEAWRAFTRAWWEKFGPRPVRVFELNELCIKHELLEGERGDGTARSQQTRLGAALRIKHDRVFGELRIGLVHDGGHNGKTYALTVVKAETVSNSPDIETPGGFLDPWGNDVLEENA